jgi:hypothetical protein
MALYSIAQFIGKDVVTAKKVPWFEHMRDDESKASGYLPKGTILRVGSYLAANPTQGRENTWFEFYDPQDNLRSFYIPIIKGYFDTSFFEEQQIFNVKKQAQIDLQKAIDNAPIGTKVDANGVTVAMTFADYASQYGLPVGLVAVGLVVLKIGLTAAVSYFKK